MTQPIIVIGGGIGGLSAAIHLAAAGRDVLVLEQNPAVGGKMRLIEAEGFTFDAGPSTITMRRALETPFAAAGRRLADYLTLEPVEPMTRYFFADGTRLDVTRDRPTLLAQIAALEPHDVEGFLAFLSHAAALHRITGEVFIYGDPPRARDILRLPLRDILKVDAWRTMHQAARAAVRDPRMRQLLSRYATYVGASPYRAPAVLNVIAHEELNEGIWYPQGGIYAIASAYRQLALELGVEIRTEARVTRINVRAGRARGVTLTDGTALEAAAVISNVDVTTTYRDLLPKTATHPRVRARRLAVEPSGSGFVLLLGIAGETPQLDLHTILFSSDYRREFDAIFRHGVPPAEPTLYINITSKRTPEHAPPGCENWFVLANAPPIGPAFDWEREAAAYCDQVLTRLDAFGLNTRARLRYQRWITPLEIRDVTGAWRGALYGASSNQRVAALQRPHNRAPDVRKLYFAGGTTHPGGGVPMVTLSGGVAARMLLEDTED